MTNATIALLALVIGLIGSIVGAFAYLMGEIRKIGTTAKADNDSLREAVNARLDSVVRTEMQERAALRAEFSVTTARIEHELRTLSERVVRRQDLEAVEARLTRGYERLETKFDGIARVGHFVRNRPSYDTEQE